MGSLTVSKVDELSQPGRYGDGGGLYLSISKGLTKSWVLRLRIDGRRTDKGLGGFPAVKLSAARKLADTYRVQVAAGKNPWGAPVKEREERVTTLDRVPTFESAARHLHFRKVQGGEITSEKHARNWLQMLERHVFPMFGDIPVDEISQREVKEFLEVIGPRLTETARRLRFRMREIFDDCVESEYITLNPAGDGIRGSVKRWSKQHKVKHFEALPYQQIPGIIDKIMDSQGMRETRLALAFQVLTATRSGEVRGATWNEIDLDAGVWTIPAARMKADREHAIPLSVQAHVILQRARAAVDQRIKRRPNYDPNGLVFPHPSGHPLSENALSDRTKKDGLGCTPHGFRSSFKGWATAQGEWSWESIELSLAHRVGNSVAQAYFRDDLLDQRRPLMQAWGDYVWNIRPF